MRIRVGYVLFSLMLASVFAGFGIWAREPVLAAYARRLAESLPYASDEQVEATLTKIARVGRPGLPSLLAAMESPRELVARTATEHILMQVGQWENGSPLEMDRRLADLVVHLARRYEFYPPSIQQEAKALALRVLRLPMLHAGRPRVEVFAACERLLEGAATLTSEPLPAASETEKPVSGRPVSPDDEQVAEYPKVRQAADWQSVVMENVASVPGGGLDGAEPQVLPEGADLDPPAWSSDSAARSQPIRLGREASLQKVPSARANEKAALEPVGEKRTLVPPAAPGDSNSEPQPIPSEAVPPVGLSKPRLYAVMRIYATGEGEAAREAENRLLDCGFKPLHFRLAKRLFHEDPEIRRTLARALPDVPGVRAETWLLYLCHDAEPAVRETALGMVLTLENPAVIREAQRIIAGAPTNDERF